MRTAIKYGLIIGFGFCVWINLEHFFGLHTQHLQIGKYTHYFTLVILILGLYFGVKEENIREYGGFITFRNALKTGVLITLIVTIIASFVMYIYSEFVNPELPYIMAERVKEELIQAEKNAEEIKNALNPVYNKYCTKTRVLTHFLETLGAGLVLSFLIAFKIKKK